LKSAVSRLYVSDMIRKVVFLCDCCACMLCVCVLIGMFCVCVLRVDGGCL
jgi:hypothetical protein